MAACHLAACVRKMSTQRERQNHKGHREAQRNLGSSKLCPPCYVMWSIVYTILSQSFCWYSPTIMYFLILKEFHMENSCLWKLQRCWMGPEAAKLTHCWSHYLCPLSGGWDTGSHPATIKFKDTVQTQHCKLTILQYICFLKKHNVLWPWNQQRGCDLITQRSLLPVSTYEAGEWNWSADWENLPACLSLPPEESNAAGGWPPLNSTFWMSPI